MSNWRRVDEIITYHGKGVTPKYVDKSSIIVLNQKCIRNNKIDYSFAQYIDENKIYNEEKFLKIGDILINSTGQGTAGRVALVEYIPENFKIIVDSHILVLRTNNFFESKCLNYSLFSIESTLQKFMDGSTGQGEFDRVRLFNVKVGYSRDISTQQKIASVLSALDDKIELNNKINAELEQMAKLLYDYWFVQFDFPNEHGKPYKSSGGKMVYNETLKREIPEGWEVENLFNVCKVQYGFPFSTDYFNEDKNGIPVIRIRDILENSISIYSTQNSIDEKYKIDIGDILVGMDGNFHINFWSQDNCYLNQRVVKLKETILQSIYLKHQIEPFIKAREKSISRTTVGHLSDKDLKNIHVIIPPENYLSIIKSIFEASLSKIISAKKQNQELAQLRDWLLPMLMNGQVKVSDNYSSDNDEHSIVIPKEMDLAAEPTIGYQKLEPFATNESLEIDPRFESWLAHQGLAARGDIDTETLREIFDAMDDEDK